MTTATKTLQATFAPPTAHKQSKLTDLLETYRDGLQAAFDTGASTMSAVSDIVTPYDLPYQAKAALCNYVPQLHRLGKADATGLDPVEEADMNNSKTTG